MLRLDWIRQHEGVLLAGGGHAMAGGVTIAFESLERFTLLFEQSTRQALAGTTLLSVLEHDGSIGCEGLTPSLLDEVASLEPYGQEFARPVFLIEHALVESAHSIGKDGLHLKLNEWPVVPVNAGASRSSRRQTGTVVLRAFRRRWLVWYADE